jgi:hypothetical protein
MPTVPSLPIDTTSGSDDRPQSGRARAASARERPHSARERPHSARERPHSAREKSEDNESSEETSDTEWSNSESEDDECTMEREALAGLEQATTIEDGMRRLFDNDPRLFHKLAWQAHFALAYRLEHGIGLHHPDCEC